MKKLIAHIIFLSAFSLMAQETDIPQSIRGKVTYSDTTKPFENVKLVLFYNGNFRDSLRTGAGGKYKFDLTHFGNYDLVAFKKGFYNDTIKQFGPCYFEDNVCEVWFLHDLKMDLVQYKAPSNYSSTIKSSLNVYPNPTSGVITVNNISQTNELVLYDVTGLLLKTIRVQPQQTQVRINLENYNSGIYFLKYIEDGIQKTTRLMRQ